MDDTDLGHDLTLSIAPSYLKEKFQKYLSSMQYNTDQVMVTAVQLICNAKTAIQKLAS